MNQQEGPILFDFKRVMEFRSEQTAATPQELARLKEPATMAEAANILGGP